MSPMMTTLERWEDRSLAQLKQVEEPVLRFTGTASERFARFVPDRPAFMAEWPTMTEFVESQLKFRKRLVDEQLRFARRMMKAMDPVVVKLDAAPKRVAAEHAHVTKLPPRKPVRKTA